MVPRRNLGPQVCCNHMIVPLGARWYLGMCEYDSTAPSFSRNPYNYPSPLSLHYLEESPHMSIASWLLKQESTQLMNNLEQECLEQNFRLIPFHMVQPNSPIHSSMIIRLPIPKVTSPIVYQLAGQNTEEMLVVCDYPDAPPEGLPVRH